ncbi:hypothetical protein [Alteribacter keqinensis]|uniref:Uncharacterized protein n=1 Tax=Alteribacter keqinensis TaxID=2483800 RepID=A0A3M7TW16_9BACI|nr:hypothetical protein [Alteribacter keqinensis]RNA68595.1 hypothetical protein EBO34_01090 [Alteribacter keqinensis]
MKTVLKSLLTSWLFWCLIIPVFIVYGTLSYATYNLIWINAEKLETMEPEIIEAKEAGETLPFRERYAYESTYNLYHKSQNLLQSFWMKYIFPFPEFTEPL